MTNKPKIAVTGPNKQGTTAWLFTALGVRLAGGEPFRITPDTFTGTQGFDGVIIGGGSDVHPDYIQEAPKHPQKRSFSVRCKEAFMYPMEFFNRFGSGGYDKPRDEMEIQFIRYALSNKLPLLGICRGHQLINATLGGSMHTSTLDVLGDNPRIRSVFPRKTVVYTKPGSLINEIAGDDPLEVNAIHSQAVASAAPELKVTAHETAGIKQVIEGKGYEKLLGVQWHPEYLLYMKAHRNIFAWVVEEAAE